MSNGSRATDLAERSRKVNLYTMGWRVITAYEQEIQDGLLILLGNYQLIPTGDLHQFLRNSVEAFGSVSCFAEDAGDSISLAAPQGCSHHGFYHRCASNKTADAESRRITSISHDWSTKCSLVYVHWMAPLIMIRQPWQTSPSSPEMLLSSYI